MTLKFREIASRLTGISCPVFGISWSPPEAECTTARRIITFLEDRRVLYFDGEMEVPEHCVESVLRIRETLTDEIGRLQPESELGQSLRAMRSACRKFLTTVDGDDHRFMRHAGHRSFLIGWTFNSSLGELRGAFGIHVAKVATAYGLDVEDELARILPIGE